MAKGKVTNIKDAKKAANTADFAATITKIAISDKDIPEIHYNLEKTQVTNDTIAKGRAKPLDSFLKAMQALATVFCEICEIGDKADDVLVHTVNWCTKGVIISAKVELTENGIPQPLCINTPLIPLENAHGGYEMPQYAKDQLEELKRQAVLYLQGEAKEKQLDMAL